MDGDVVLVFKPADELIIRRAGITTPVRLIEPWLDEPPMSIERSGTARTSSTIDAD
jgi:hypothetical protein